MRPPPPWWEWALAGACLLLSTGALLPWLQGSEARAPGAGGNSTTIVLWGFFYVVAAVQLSYEGVERLRSMKMDWALVGVVVVAVLSTMWSLDGALTIRRSIALGGTVLIGVWFGLRFATPRFLVLLSLVLGAVALVNLGFGFTVDGLDPRHLADRAWRGAFASKNLMAQVTVLTLIVFVISAVSAETPRRWIYGAGAVLAAGLVIMTASATGLVMALALIPVFSVLFYTRAHPKKGTRAVFVGASVLLVGVLMLSSGLASLDPAWLFGLLGRNETLTGRTEIWAAVVDAIADRPLFGYGHGAFWAGVEGEGSGAIARQFGQDAGYAHNGFMDAVLGFGFVGLAFWLASFVQTLGLAVRQVANARIDRALWPIMLLLFLIMANLTEGGLIQQNHYMLILYTAVGVRLRR